MTGKKYIVILFLFLFTQFCFSQNLIQNGSFEDSVGNSSLTGWDAGDTVYVLFSNDVPPNGEMWSVTLTPSWVPNSYMIWHLTGIQGNYIYNLTLWTKSTWEFFPTYSPYIGIGIKTNSMIWKPDSMLQQSTIYVYDSTINNYWQKKTLIDTITSSVQDTIAVIFYGGNWQFPDDSVSFDLIELTITDTPILTQNTKIFQTMGMATYPNPVNDNTTIKFNNKIQDNIQLTLFTITGEIILQKETTEEQIIIAKGKLSSGIYFYRLINYNNEELFGCGKLIIQ